MILPIFPVILTKNPIFTCEIDAKMMQWFFGLPTSFPEQHQFYQKWCHSAFLDLKWCELVNKTIPIRLMSSRTIPLVETLINWCCSQLFNIKLLNDINLLLLLLLLVNSGRFWSTTSYCLAFMFYMLNDINSFKLMLFSIKMLNDINW